MLEDATWSENTGMVWENGPFVYLCRRKRQFLRAPLGEVYTTFRGLPLRPRITGPEGISFVKCAHRLSRSGVESQIISNPAIKSQLT